MKFVGSFKLPTFGEIYYYDEAFPPWIHPVFSTFLTSTKFGLANC